MRDIHIDKYDTWMARFLSQSYRKLGAKDIDELAALPQEELVLHFCERHVLAVMAKSEGSTTD